MDGSDHDMFKEIAQNLDNRLARIGESIHEALMRPRKTPSMPGEAERRRYALLQAAAVIWAAHHDAGTDTVAMAPKGRSFVSPTIDAAEALLSEIERRELAALEQEAQS